MLAHGTGSETTSQYTVYSGQWVGGFRSDWSTLIGPAPRLLRSHWSRTSLVILAPAVLCHKEPARTSTSWWTSVVQVRSGDPVLPTVPTTRVCRTVPEVRNSGEGRGGLSESLLSEMSSGVRASSTIPVVSIMEYGDNS